MSIRARHLIHGIRRASWVLATPVTLAMLAPALRDAVQAQALVPSGSLVLGDLYREVARTNPRAEAARSLARAADARVASAKRPPDPQLQLGFMNYGVPSLRPMDALGMTQLQLMQMLPVGGKLGLAGRVAESRASADGQRADDVAWEVRTQAAMAFYEIYVADQSLTVARETLRLLQDIAGTAEAMYRVGEGRQADVLRARVEIARMTEDTIRMQAMRTGMTARLGALLNRGADTVVIASPAFDTRALGWIGFATRKPFTEDYVPLFPWAGVMLIGIAAGHLIARTDGSHVRAFEHLPALVRWLGRHSLAVYMLHQPLLLGALWIAVEAASRYNG